MSASSLDTRDLALPPTAAPRELPPAVNAARLLVSRATTFCVLELRRIAHDRSELYTRAIQPALWLLVFGETFTRLRAIPTGHLPYLDFLAPGIMAQSALFIAIFYGIQIIWERDAGMLSKLLATPTPRAALVFGKSFAAGVRGATQVVVILILCAILRVGINWNPLNLLGAVFIVVISAGFFSCLSMTIAGLVLSRERLMGIGQAITMPLFFSSSALYPTYVMPGWLQAISKVNPLTYEVEALRGLLIGWPTTLWLDTVVLAGATLASITCASLLLPRLANR
ncbi:MAG: ABC transporter permease [Candidatus Dormibacteraeota bacterium]|nr:ABC transporter permease [Candidatus Dormibacteraeota bacterium]